MASREKPHKTRRLWKWLEKLGEKFDRWILENMEDSEDDELVICCPKCFNARVDPDGELTDDNDFSSFSIGTSGRDYRIMYSSGYGKPPRLEVEKHDDKLGWTKVAEYRPKYCPECGREITEYEQRK